MKQLLEQLKKKNKKRKVHEQSKESTTFEMDEDLVRIVEELRGTPKPPVSSKSQKRKNIPRVDKYFMPRTIPGA